MPTDHEYDVFISHATEDKEGFVRPLAEALTNAGLRVWYDESTLRLGDSLRGSVDQGLLKSAFGVVVLSRSFFEKHWPQRELDGLTALEASDGRRRILPVWHGVSQAEVANYSPLLANVVAASTSTRSLDQIVREVIAVVSSGGEAVHAVYDRVHNGIEIDLVALARESGGYIEGHLFRNCRLVGPVVLRIEGDVSFVGITFGAEQLWPLDPGRPYVGGVPIRRSRIEDCALQGVGIAGPGDQISRIFYLPRPPE